VREESQSTVIDSQDGLCLGAHGCHRIQQRSVSSEGENDVGRVEERLGVSDGRDVSMDPSLAHAIGDGRVYSERDIEADQRIDQFA